MIDQTVFEQKKVAFYTLGCKLNFSETSNVARQMQEAGFQKVGYHQVADVYVINTCSVTDLSDKKCRNAIKKAVRQNPNAFVVVTGCYAQLKPGEIAGIEGVDLILGSNEKTDILQHLDSLEKNGKPRIVAGEILKDKVFKPSFSSGDRTRSFLKIQDGCDYFCSYCTIPLARGTSRSDSVANTVEQAREAAQRGAKEIILTGVNIGDFGRKNGESFLELIRALETVEGVERYRISSIEPNLLTEQIIDFVASSRKFMPHFHIPIQSGCNEVLKLMKRKYNRELFASRVNHIKTVIPHAFIGVDVIVGVNGETEAYFQETLDFLTGIEASQLHVFTYSERPNTQALKIEGKVPVPERQRRSHLLLELSEQKRLGFYKQHLGLEAPVLFESTNHEGIMHGFTNNYIKVEVPFDRKLVNTIQTVVMKSLTLDKQAIHAEIKPQP